MSAAEIPSPTQALEITAAKIAAVSRIAAVQSILEVVCQVTGLRFAAIAHVTPYSWTACAVRDTIDFGVAPGHSLPVESTICHEIEQSRQPVVIDNVSRDPLYCTHHTPKMYGFQSYISMPIVTRDGEFFGTLCALDPLPATLSDSKTQATFEAFAQLIALQLEESEQLRHSQRQLHQEKQTAELREQFIAVIGHDLRTPLAATTGAAEVLLAMSLPDKAQRFAQIVQLSGRRMTRMIDDLLDFARGRLGGGIALALDVEPDLGRVLRRVAEELQIGRPEQVIQLDLHIDRPLRCDALRVAQIFSNLLSNALTHGAAGQPVAVHADCADGRLRFSVSNRGEPIPAARRERLFQPFSRKSGDRVSDGLGLGLYIASQLAAGHGGSLSVQSDAEHTTFTLQIPIVEA